MAFGTSSKVFRAFFADAMDRTAAFDLDTDAFKAALYGNTGTPDPDGTAANTKYNAGAWVTGNELTSSTDWPAGGKSITTPSVNRATAGVVFWDGDDVASGSAATITAAYGCLCYDDTLTTPQADQGVCYNYFGGSNSVTNGTFTISWSANGIWRATL
jgi:hypothetical protein